MAPDLCASESRVASPDASLSRRAENGMWHSICVFCGSEVYAPNGGWTHSRRRRIACDPRLAEGCGDGCPGCPVCRTSPDAECEVAP